MKLSLLLFLLSFSISIFAQPVWDFETTAQDTGWTLFANGPNQNDTDFAIVNNPNMSGLNTSAHVAKLVVRDNADLFAGVFNNKITPFYVTAQNAHPTIMVYKTVTSRVDFKYEGDGFGGDHFDSNTVANQWQKLTYDFSAFIGKQVKTITVIPDFPATRTVGSVCYFDMIEFVAGVVPVELTSFTASTNSAGIELKWSTSTETNNSGFEIERSTNNINFQKIGFVNGHGTSTNINKYSYVDNNVSGKFFYRLKQIDFSGGFKYSKAIEVNTSNPLSFALNQNYPNPFNPTTTISYSIPENSFVTIKVYNVLGVEVASLINNQVEAGEHNIQFNASNDLSSGVYFYTIKTGNFSATKKLMLLK
jgi:Secretion system C-terminal sorting domain